MKITKEELKSLILEEYKKTINEQEPEVTEPWKKQDPKQILKQNTNKQLKLLRFMRETLKQAKLPQELETMIKYLQNAKTFEFLDQVLQVEKSIPINISAVLTNPIGLLQAIIDEILKNAVRKANQKLAEGKKEFDSILTEEFDSLKELEEMDFHFGHDPQSRLEKHKRKEMKKNVEKLPPINLSPEDKKIMFKK